MVSDTVVAIVPEETLPGLLTQVHRSGLGQNARVLRPRRSPVSQQLRRAGVPIEQAPERIEGADCILMIMAAARSPMAAELALHHGASATWIITRSGTWNLVDDHVVMNQPGQPATHGATMPADLRPEESSDAIEPI